MRKRRLPAISAPVCLAVCCAALLWATTARADVFVLNTGGQVRGELLNRQEAPRKQYQIRLAGGGEVSLAADQVKEVKRQSVAETQYDRMRGNYDDTVQGQWELAEWCRDHHLSSQRKTHLERIIELDPNHVQARRGLGYSQVKGRWVTQEMLMTESGYVKYKNSWVLPQEIEIREQEAKAKAAQSEWSTKLKRWHSWLATDKARQAEENIRTIDDPNAAGPLAKYLNDPKEEDSRRVRLVYVEALGRLKGAAGMEALVTASLFDDDEEVRLAALDQVAAAKYLPAVSRYVKALKNIDNAIINRAGLGLGQMKDPSAIGPLIDSLVTTHTYEVQEGQAGNMNSSFGSGPGGGGGSFSFGSPPPKIVKENYENRDVLQALVLLSGGANYAFDRTAWRHWYTAQRRPQNIDARRDDAK